MEKKRDFNQYMPLDKHSKRMYNLVYYKQYKHLRGELYENSYRLFRHDGV